MKSFIKKILLFANFLFAFFLLLTYLPGIISPGKVSLFSFLSLFYPFLLIINVCFVLFWGFFLKKYIFISIIAILIRIDYIPLYVQNNKTAVEEPTADAIRIMSFNTHLFRYGQTNVNENHIQKFMELVEEYMPNIICFQEFTSNNQKKELNTLDILKKKHAFKHHFSLKNSKHFVYSNTILSKYPIINKGNAFENHTDKDLPRHRFIYADLKIGEDTVRVYNVHFSSFHLDEEDRATYEEIVSQQKFDNKKSKRLYGKLSKTMKKHGEEVQILIEHISSSPHRKIVCGDFNDTPASYAYQKLTKQLNDSYREKGKGIGKTYNGSYPAFRIDYILPDKDFSIYDFHVLKAPISDHYPIFSTIEINSK